MQRMLLAAALLAAMTLPALAAPAKKPVPKPPPPDKLIGAVLAAQALAWNRGDLKAFMAGYVNSPKMTYTAGGVVVRGWDALRKRYEERYGRTPDTMGTLRFDDLEISLLGKDVALAVGRWFLRRTGQPDIDGVFSLVWQKTSGGWRILHDHSSLREPPKPPAGEVQ
jgi:ketosteroid isomerase-like protein